MPYPYDPPLPPTAWDIEDRQVFTALYQWAGSANKLARWLSSAGIQVTGGTINNWRNKHHVPIVNEVYARRSGQHENPVSAPEISDEQVQQLIHWLSQNPPTPHQEPLWKTIPGRRKTEIVGCDVHFPHHHEAAFECFLGAVEKIQPDGVTMNGDTFDFNQIGKYIKNPNTWTAIQSDLDEGNALLQRVGQVAPKSRRILVFGNHERPRWENYLWTRCPEIASLDILDFERMLKLNKIDWEFHPDGHWLIPDTLIVDHGSRHTNMLGGGSGQSARKEMLDIGTSGVSGHTHKLGMFYRQDGKGYRVWAEGGCLCDQEKMRRARVTANKRGPKKEDWHLGFIRVDYGLHDGEGFTITPIPIIDNGRRTFCIVDGEEITA